MTGREGAVKTGESSQTAGRRRVHGAVLAVAAAVISGVAVFTNGYGVKAFGNPAIYTTAKNLVAAVVIAGLLLAMNARRSSEGLTRPRGWAQWAGLATVVVIGGSVPFVLFFQGLARVSSPNAAFIQKTLVVWVALLAAPLLRERVGPWHIAAIGLLVWGEAAAGGGVRGIGPGSGEIMILIATLLWSVEIIAAYVSVWFSALARAPAVDVTAILVFGAIITALLQAGVQSLPLAPQALGLVLIVAGSAVAVALALAPRGGAGAAP